MRKANAKNSVWANELFDVLWNIDDPKIHKEMLSLVEGLAGKGDAGSMLRLARMYRDGKGVEKDVEKAVELLEKASQTRPDAKKELEEIRKTL
jgi:TPR repeat protein